MNLKLKLSKLIINADRWLLNHIFKRSRIIEIALSDCVDEFGNTFGKSGSHFFVRALNQGKNYDSVANFLREYYDKNQIVSFNEEVNSNIKSIEGFSYFCPWEEGRIRPLEKFIYSHKVGPTNNEALSYIVLRILKVFNSINNNNLPAWRLLDGYPRVIKIIDKNQKERFLIRDGNHRLSVYSCLNFNSVKVCYEADYWKPSKVFRFFYRVLKNKNYHCPKRIKAINELEVESWPHVKSGLVSASFALKFFHIRFKKSFNSISE